MLSHFFCKIERLLHGQCYLIVASLAFGVWRYAAAFDLALTNRASGKFERNFARGSITPNAKRQTPNVYFLSSCTTCFPGISTLLLYLKFVMSVITPQQSVSCDSVLI